MCGLCGVASRYLSSGEIDIFESLLTVCTLRGQFGSGLAAMPSKRGSLPAILRCEYTGAALASSEAFSKVRKNQLNCIMGHTRLPTTGSFDISHIHPFKHKHIIGVHNGVFSRVMGEAIKADASDSGTFFEAVAEHGIKKVIEESSGAYSLVWYDLEDETVNFLRNSLRPLYFQRNPSPHIGTLFWASEAGMLDFCVSRKSSYFKHEIKATPENIHIKMPLFGRDSFSFIEEEIKTRFSFPVRETQYYSRFREWGEEYDWVGSRSSIEQTATEKTSKTTETIAEQLFGKNSNPTLAIEDKRENKRFTLIRDGVSVPSVNARDLPGQIEEIVPNHFRNFHEIHKTLQSGCEFCGHPGLFMDHKLKRVVWWTPDKFLCADCGKSAMARSMMRDVYGERPVIKPVLPPDAVHPDEPTQLTLPGEQT